MVKRAAVAVLEHVHVLLDLDSKGNVLITFSELIDQPADLRGMAGHFGNLLVAELAHGKLDEQSKKGRNLLVAGALDGALPKRKPDCLDDLEAPCDEEAHSIGDSGANR